MAHYGMDDWENHTGYYAKSVQATRKHKIVFIIIAVVIVATVALAIIKAL